MPSLKKEEIYHCFFTKNLSPKDCVEIFSFFFLDKILLRKQQNLGNIWNLCFSTVHFTTFPKIWEKKIQIFEISNLSKNGGKKKSSLVETKGSNLREGFNDLVSWLQLSSKGSKSKTMWHVTCDLCTRLCLEWKLLGVFPFALKFPIEKDKQCWHSKGVLTQESNVFKFMLWMDLLF